jgi:N-methylhydantoinase A
VADVGGASPDAQGDGRVGARRAFCPKKRAWTSFAVHRRASIAPGIVFAGPAIVEENESTTVVPSGALARVDGHGSLIVDLAP